MGWFLIEQLQKQENEPRMHNLEIARGIVGSIYHTFSEKVQQILIPTHLLTCQYNVSNAVTQMVCNINVEVVCFRQRQVRYQVFIDILQCLNIVCLYYQLVQKLEVF